MYSGSTLTNFSGRLIGAHQKIDRLAHRHLRKLAPTYAFPPLKQILQFEGHKGPDALKRKSPAHDEPWHYFEPFNDTDNQIVELIEEHYQRLITCLKAGDDIRAAFEAAWLAHAVVDGLTPAHHYPYEEKLVELRSGRGKETRTSIKKKLILPGETTRHQLSNNWKMWGPKGLFTTHGAFEWGFAVLIAPLRLTSAFPSSREINKFMDLGVANWFRQVAQEIAELGLYDTFYATGWTNKLAREVRRQLAPSIVQAVTLVWFGAAQQAGVVGQPKAEPSN